ncbi:MAG: DUF6443 domain-containing protein, partial [Dysgonomonas sp.]|nr:DUF6443 domain-containing protein [Dysgonomonas sp.]
MKHIIYKILLSVLLIGLYPNGYVNAQDDDPYYKEKSFILNPAGGNSFDLGYLDFYKGDMNEWTSLSLGVFLIDEQTYEEYINNSYTKFSVSFTSKTPFELDGYLSMYPCLFYVDPDKLSPRIEFTMTGPNGEVSLANNNFYISGSYDMYFDRMYFDAGTYTFHFEVEIDGPFQYFEIPDEFIEYGINSDYELYFGFYLLPPSEPVQPDPFTPSIPSTASLSSDQNYIHSRTFTSEDGKKYLDQVQYFDGLGRPVQTVQRAITPSAKDLVSIQEYDAFGREAESWLPGLSTGNGAYANIEAVKQSAKNAEMNNDTNPFSKPVYENSPLNRVLEQYGPGADWHNNSKRVQTAYKTNVAGNGLLNCVLYAAGGTNATPTLTKGGNYTSGELYVTEVKDEDGNTSYEFKDKLGQVVLTRQINEGVNHDTYYVYNDFGNLCYVLPPEINDNISQDNLNKYAYLYKYDERNRCIWKKLPGCEHILYVYDKADRMIFSQDGEQRKDNKNEWTFNKYDAFGRVVMTGLQTINKTHAELRTLTEGVVVKEEYKLDSHWSYTWNSLTSILTATNYKKILAVNYYDNYQFRQRHDYANSKFA